MISHRALTIACSLWLAGPALADNLPGGSNVMVPTVSVGGTPFVVTGGSAAQSNALRGSRTVTPWDFAGAYGDTQRLSCVASITSGANTLNLTGTGCAFSAGDVGKYITIPNAGAALATGSVTSVPVTSPGSAYTTVPTITLGNVGSGLGFKAIGAMQMATAAVVSGGTGCPNGAITFNVDPSISTSVAQVSGTVSGGVLSGALTVVTAGVYSQLPSVTSAPLTSTSTACATAPTISSTWAVNSVLVRHPGWGFVAGVTASVSAGNATVGTPVVSIGNNSLATTIQSVTDANNIVLVANASATLASSTVLVAWGHDDGAAINSAINTCAHNTNASCEVYLPPSPSGYWGTASIVNLAPNALPVKIRGAGPNVSTILALAPMAELGFQGSGGGPNGGVFEDFTLDGNKVATNTVYLNCSYASMFRNTWFRNPAPQGTNWIVGNPAGNLCPNVQAYNVSEDILSALYVGAQDLPYYNLQVNETDSQFVTNFPIGGLIAYAQIGPQAANTLMIEPHGYGGGGGSQQCASDGLQIYAFSNVYYPRSDCAENSGVYISGNHIQIFGGELQKPGPLASQINIAENSRVITIDGYDCLGAVYNSTACLTRATPIGDHVDLRDIKGYSGNLILGDGVMSNVTTPGASNTIVGQGAGLYLAGNNNAIFGPFSIPKAQGSSMAMFGFSVMGGATTYGASGNWTAFGSQAFYNSGAAATAGAAFGAKSCGALTTGGTVLCLGNFVGSTTLQTGSDDILIGVSAAVDTDTSSRSHEMNIGNVIFANLAATSSPAIVCGSSPSVDAHSNGKSGTVTCGTGVVATGTITYSTAYQSWVHCRVTPHSTLAAFSYSTSLSAITINATSLTSAVLDYDCDGV